MKYTTTEARQRVKDLYEMMLFYQELSIGCETKTITPRYSGSKNFYSKEAAKYNEMALKNLEEIKALTISIGKHSIKKKDEVEKI